jgi:hypothetical protein
MGDAQTAAVEAPTPLQLRLDQFIQVRDKIEAMKEKHKEELAPLNKALLMLNGKLLEMLLESGSDSATVRDIGTVYKTIKKSASIADGDAFRQFIIANAMWNMIDWRANSTAVDEYIQAEGNVPPGVNFRQVAVVGVRRANDR